MARLANRATSKEVLFDLDVRQEVGTLREIREQYISLLSERLYPEQLGGWPNLLEFRELLSDEGIVTAFCVENGRIVATGESILVRANPNWQAVIGNMATLEASGRSGYGTAILDALVEESCSRWDREHRKIQLTLTNNKNKGNFAFYVKNGWIESPTTVYYLPRS